MLGAIIGDIVGSRFEWHNHRSKDFELFTDDCFFTDDSVMTVAITKALLNANSAYTDLSDKAIYFMQDIGRHYPNAGYGGRFGIWMFSDNPTPYDSYGNGAAMRVSACGEVGNDLDQALSLSDKVTIVTHGHKEGLKGARATVECMVLAKNGYTKEQIRKAVEEKYYKLDFTLDEIRFTYRFNETCQNTVPQAIEAFLESESFEDAIRNAISIGGDSDTLAAITGAIAESYYGIPLDLRNKALSYLDERLKTIVFEFEKKYPPIIK